MKISAMEHDDQPAQVDWPLHVSDGEIRAAKYEWLAARDGNDGMPAEHVALRFEYYRALISMQAQQIADDLRAQHRTA
ncbi:MAG: hypothetical protein BGO38_11420 [Cellulomonas sp. 73-145]|uniref:hypothetical protein n=1 Tax=Cellulomonas sp. 73-145 TaxID=1895739 RepID=UPI000927825D|nr:hypothetical protein [Cellulomonas sp. 73-145]MBN9327576.1 hypothetical protein [Cellulomonas sp.]OJV57367.1 MAG: hypothetical protein BGO38_11420 [Cellulomonas sp. 73-145]